MAPRGAVLYRVLHCFLLEAATDGSRSVCNPGSRCRRRLGRLSAPCSKAARFISALPEGEVVLYLACEQREAGLGCAWRRGAMAQDRSPRLNAQQHGRALAVESRAASWDDGLCFLGCFGHQ